MEDSYTVHRRRKAAARRREKTPEASRGTPVRDNDIEDDEEDNEKIEARARMEKMVEDTEKLEELANDGRNTSPAVSNPQINPKEETESREVKENEEKENIQMEIVEEPKEEQIQEQLVSLNIDKQDPVNLPDPVEHVEENNRVKAMNENRMDFKRVKAKGETLRRQEKRWSSSDSSLDENFSKKADEERRREKKPRKGRKEPKPELKLTNPVTPQKHKQIIPLSNDSLIEDFKKAQRNYEKREIGILDPEFDDYVNPTIEAALRRRKKSTEQIKLSEEVEEIKVPERDDEKVFGSWTKVWTWLWHSDAKKDKIELDTPMIKDKPMIDEKIPSKSEKQKEKIEKETPTVEETTKKIKEEIPSENEKTEKKSKWKLVQFIRLLSDFRAEFRAFADCNPHETHRLRMSRNKCINQLILIIIYCGLGAFAFRFIEGAFETFYKCGVKRVKRDFLDNLWDYSHNMREDDWKSMARRKLMEFEEQLHAAHEAGVHSYSGLKSWSFLNAVVYCLTVIFQLGHKTAQKWTCKHFMLR